MIVLDLWPRVRTGIKRNPTREEALRQLRLQCPVLMSEAIRAEPWGHSWRPQPVKFGCALLAARQGYSDEDRFAIFTGSNFTLTSLPRPADRPKMCSERVAALQALEAGYYVIIGGALFSRHMQRDDVSDKFFRTPHACYECTEFFELIFAPYARFITMRPRYLACDAIDITDPWRHTSLVVEEEDYQQLIQNHEQDHAHGHHAGR